jgi:hypothetical protein
MIIAVSPASAVWIRVAARSVLLLYIGGAGIGLCAGAAALAFAKGSTLHRWAGNAFCAGMLTMSLLGAATAPLLPTPQWESMFVGLLTFCLVATAWMSIRRKTSGIERADLAAFALVSGVALVALAFGLHAAFATGASRFYAVPDFVFGSIATLAAAGDWRMIRRGGLESQQRLVRHLWRMCVALLIAAFSFFIGQQQVLPHAVQGSPLLLLPEIAVLATLLYWLQRSRRARAAAGLFAAPTAATS